MIVASPVVRIAAVCPAVGNPVTGAVTMPVGPSPSSGSWERATHAAPTTTPGSAAIAWATASALSVGWTTADAAATGPVP